MCKFIVSDTVKYRLPKTDNRKYVSKMEMQDGDIGAYFDGCARNGFMESFSPEEKPKIVKLLRLWNITPGQRVLEPGCGSGRLTAHIAKAVGEGGFVYACDLSQEMIRRARSRGLPVHVRFVCGSVESIQADSEYFDTAICFSVFPHFSDPNHALGEIHRVLKAGGHLWINHLKDSKTLNDMHHNAASFTIAHPIPEAGKMRLLFDDSGFTIRELLDSPETGYRLHAIKKQ